jgi:SAM-dependent methyltransferase
MVMLHDVLEHLHGSPRDLLNDLLELTKPGGLLFVTVPNAANIKKRIELLFGRTNMHDFASYYWYPGPWRGHNREYVRNDLVELSACLDLDVLELRGCDHMLQKVPGVVRPAYLLATRFLQGWKDSWLLVARKRARWSPKRRLPQDELTRILRRTMYVEPEK